MAKVVRTLHAVGYDGVIDYDHPIGIIGDAPLPKQYMAFAVGYMRGLLDSCRRILAALLLILPGIVSDVIALLLLLLPINLGAPLATQPAGLSRGFGRDSLEGDFHRVD